MRHAPSTGRAALAAALTTLLLVACGGGDGGSTNTTSGTTADGTPGAPGSPALPAAGPLTLTKLEFAQTHVLPEGGLAWTLPNTTGSFKLIGNRGALALVAIGQTDVQQPKLEAWRNGTLLGSLALNAPAALPPTESNGRPYATDRWSATVPAAWMAPGTSFRVSAANYTASDGHTPSFGTDADITLRVLPFYLFGANDTNTKPLSSVRAPDTATQQEIFAKWPVSALKATNHPIGRVAWSNLVIGPRNDRNNVAQPAYAMTAMNQQQDGYAVMSAVLSLIGGLRAANGESPTNNQYYAPILSVDPSTGREFFLGGGLGSIGGGTGVGDENYTGIFIHEQGHAFGLPHAGAAYTAGTYPYAGGSLTGSVWGYDPNHNQFLDIRVPTTASSYANCASSHQTDSAGHCIKQDPMQGGAGDQSPGYKFATFSDFNAGKMQAWLQGQILTDAASPTGYSKWDANAQARVAYTPATTSNGLYGINQNLPAQTNVPVVAIAITFSRAGTAGVSQIYPPLPYTGNLIRTFDPASAADRAAIVPNTGTYAWYCHASGCDYTVRVTYDDGSQITRVLQGGFRPWFSPTGTPAANTTDPSNGASFKLWTINVPGDKAIAKVELLDTPTAWNGLPATPTVLLSR
ncbi:M66 family metalloprotease [Ralstonia sp. UBA689]|uniref:M66 family metalloprotease n=1 Tax=Ralstonia sp. UBA689 TaxID=1947373 RepID=UPI0025D643F5|nr:M66 family metalloprotease [Ralstonia sp. UBA689]